MFAASPNAPSTDGHLTDGDGLASSPLVLPGAGQSPEEMEVPELLLDRAVEEVHGPAGKAKAA